MLEAADGKQGLDVAHAEQPDLIITDVLMPVMDGYDFARQLRLDPSTSHTPVVFYTAHYGQREAAALAQSTGVSSVLMKPAATSEVLAVVGRALSHQPGPPGEKFTGADFDREHLRLLTDKLSEKAEDLRAANARLRAINNIGLELAAEREPGRLLQYVCHAARDLFGATYVTLGVLDLATRTVQRVETCGTDAPDWIGPGDAIGGILGTVVTERRAVRGGTPGGDFTSHFPVLHPDVQTFLAAPVASPNHVFGWFCLVGNEGRCFNEDDEDLLSTLAGQVGRAYENNHFRAVAQARAIELEHEAVERRSAESALRQECDRAQRYLDTAAVILLALDLEGRVTLANKYTCTMLGWTAGELVGRDWFDTCIPACDRDLVRSRFAGILAGGPLLLAENLVVTRSGEQRLVEWQNTVLGDETGEVTGTFSSGTDITERNRAVAALRTAEERMRFALQNANVGIWDMDSHSGQLRWSETLEAQYGLAPGEFAGTFEAFVACTHPDDRAALLATIEPAMKSGEEFSVTSRTLRPDGSIRWLSGTGQFHLDDRGEPVRGVGISLDVTDRRAMEAQFLQAQKMEAIGRLAGGVAHDFNNLLTVILGHCEILLADLLLDDRCRADIGAIEKAGVSAARLTRQLLAFSRKEIIQPTLLDLNAVVRDMQAMLTRLIGEDLTVRLGLRARPAWVTADRNQIEHVVVNLAINARHAMPKGGTLTIETDNVDLDEHYETTHLAAPPGPYVVLTVTDTGTGMSEEVKSRLFEPFFTTKEMGKGTGLGLATVHGVVKQSGGRVNVYSELGRGSSFKVYLPLAAAAATAVELPPIVVPPPKATQTILLVDDAAGLRALAKRLLEREGYKVLAAADGDEAMRLFDDGAPIDVLLTDVVMPGASGPELGGRLAKGRPLLKVIYMSGYTEDAIVQHGVLKPGITFLHKPFTGHALLQIVRDTIER